MLRMPVQSKSPLTQHHIPLTFPLSLMKLMNDMWNNQILDRRKFPNTKKLHLLHTWHSPLYNACCPSAPHGLHCQHLSHCSPRVAAAPRRMLLLPTSSRHKPSSCSSYPHKPPCRSSAPTCPRPPQSHSYHSPPQSHGDCSHLPVYCNKTGGHITETPIIYKA